MLFNSYEFLVFLPVVLGVYYGLARAPQNVLLVAASYFFYGWWDWRFCSLLAFSSVLAHVSALRMEAASPRARRGWLVACLAGNLGVLAFFKYFNFFVGSAAAALGCLGLRPNLPILRVILPVGISFYTFQALSYTIDVYRGLMAPSRSLLNVAAYISFFPQLVAGPIERAEHLLPQFERPRRVTGDMAASGALLMLFGFVKKLAIADAVAGDVEAAFSQGHTAAWPVLLRGAWLFSLQIYCDFSGYSDIARGTARLFGFELMRNFQQPYLATNVSEFWHRWHVSLSTFLRDYLYIPLGGSRGSRLKTHRNLMVTMLLGGLWHGANWTFVVWGGLHGAYLSIHRLLLRGQKPCERIRASTPAAFARDLMRVAVTFHIVTFTWVFFRAPSLADAFSYLWGLFTLRGGWAGQTFEMLRMAGFFALALLLDAPQYAACDDTVALRWRWTVRGALIAGLLLCIFLLAPADETPFIYFQF